MKTIFKQRRVNARFVGVGLALSAATPLCAAAHASETWRCRNADLEISCDADGCAAAPQGGFTPMDIALTAESLTVCAYSGCWGGAAVVREDGELRYAAAPDLTWSAAPDGPATAFQLAFDAATGVGALIGAGYAHPVACDRAAP